MKKFRNQIVALLMAVAMLLSFTACRLKDDATAPADAASAETPSDDTPAIKIGDDIVITYGEIAEVYESYVSQYAYMGMARPTEQADIETLQDYVVEQLVSDRLLLNQAKLQGVTLTQDELDGLDADVEDEMAYYMDMFRSSAESEGAADVEARTLEIFQEQLTASGMDMTVDEYRAYRREVLEQSAMVDALQARVTDGITATEEECRAYYDDLLQQQKATYAETPDAYGTDEEEHEKFGGDPVLFVPEGYVRVKTITISPSGEPAEGYDALLTELDELEAEYGQLALGRPTGYAAKMAAVKKDYDAKKKESAAMFDAYVADARTKANQAYTALKNGTTFEEAIQTYGEDDLYTQYPSFLETGILMQTAGDALTDPAITAAINQLKPGQYSGPIAIDDQFYLLYLVGPETAGERAYEDVLDSVTELAAQQKKDAAWSEQQEEWLADTSMVTYFEDVYRGIK